MKGTLLDSVPPRVTTWTVPVVAPAGTAAVISDFDFTVNVAAMPLKVTLTTLVQGPSTSTCAPCAHFGFVGLRL